MLKGEQSWSFSTKPAITASAAVVGPYEGKGPLGQDFDFVHDDPRLGEDSWEKAEKRLLEDACQTAMEKASVQKEDVQFFLGGDLMAQLITSSFAARTLSIPFLGIFGACSTSMEGLALAAQLVDSGAAETVMCGTASHNSSAEKQFRYPTEYGGQKPPTAQWTVTGAGSAILQPANKASKTSNIRVTGATIGKVVDMGVSDPFNMGGAMAPAAVDTITGHFRDFKRSFDDYDLIVTGDLGRVGFDLANDLFSKAGFKVPDHVYQDCGLLMYGDDPNVLAGGSGCACSATVTYGHILKRMQAGELRRVLVAATGALLSPLSYQQKESIPSICHAVVLEVTDH
ncbi:stage V sporulation protein AD [Caldalkalibacillus salinus]|uniref:stage V sporulation protein AD n=1 Tax=Caldalkalibacillus salinus TaxID=2803787 RepID=UPI00192363B5|nr:stage V sporulation protein AD [Caldalkalibacillus salinus]